MKIHFLWIGISLLQLHCGVPNPTVTKQEVRGVTRPAYAPPTDVFHLVPDGSIQGFEGSSMIFSPTLTSDTMMKIIELSSYLKSAMGKQGGFYAQHRLNWKDLQSREKKRQSEIDALLDAEKTSLNQGGGAEQALAISSAIQTEVIAMQERLNNLPLLAKKNFPLFCEARIWLMATSPFLLAYTFTARPSPFVACEAEYKKAGLLDVNAAVCAPDSNGKDYFSCFWEEGVLKSQFFVGIKKPRNTIFNYTPEEQAQIRSIYASGALRAQAMEKRNDLCQGIFSMPAGGTIPDGQNPLLENRTAKYWSDASNPLLESGALPSLFEERSFGAEKVSFQDRLFNWNLMVSPPETPFSFIDSFNREAAFQKELVATGQMKGGSIYDKSLSVPPSLKDEEIRLLKLIQIKIQSKFRDALVQEQTMLKEKEATYQDSINEANQNLLQWIEERDSVISICKSVKLSLNQTTNNMMQIHFELSPTYSFSACMNATTGATVACETPSTSTIQSELSWNPVTGKISLVVANIQDASDLCLVSNSSFGKEQFLQKDFLMGKQLRVDLFPRKLSSEVYENLELVSGKIAVESGGVKDTEGVILLFQTQERLSGAL